MSRFLLIDGNSLTYRAFFALPTDMMTSSGQVTNALHGFTMMLATLLRDHEPDGIAVAFDRPEKTFRHERLATYKANREKQPDILYEQLALAREIVESLGMCVVDALGFEADDVLATLADLVKKSQEEAIIVTGDRDSYQLVEDPHVKVLYNKRGVSDYVLYDEEGIKERTGVSPEDYVAYAALRGDTSDNLPGVPGVGEKTAAKLINTYGGLEEVLAAAEEQTPKLRQNLEESQDLVLLNSEMMKLVTDVPLNLEINDLKMKPVDVPRASELFNLLELSKSQSQLGSILGVDSWGGDELGVSKSSSQKINVKELSLVTEKTFSDSLQSLTDCKVISIGIGENIEDGIAAFCGKDPGEAEVLLFPHELLKSSKLKGQLTTLFGGAGPGLATHNVKFLIKILRSHQLASPKVALDTQLAGYLLDPADENTDLTGLLERHTSWEVESIGSPEGQLALGEEESDASLALAQNAVAVSLLVEPLSKALDSQNLRSLNDEVEIPLAQVLVKMEELGVGVDVKELNRLRDDLTAQCTDLREEIHEIAGMEFNVNSTKQLREVLFENLGLTPGKKTKTGYSTDAATLERLRGEHPIIEKILSYREVEKLRSTYGEGLLASVGPEDRIRATFKQTVARTGRLSSDAPNLHNIPVRTEAGRAFRKAFVPAEGFSLLVADYNQIELRCIAHLAEDPGLIAAFEAGDDVHTAVASQVWNVKPEQVDSETRSRAKMVSYGLAYGMEAYGLAQRLDIPRGEAEEILNSFFTAFPAVREYMDRSIEEARKKGYTETLFGRRRRIPELSSSNFNIRQAGERQAMNSAIQGLAADIFKVALIRIDEHIENNSLSSRLILQVHDEVILEVPPEEKDEALEKVPEIMQNAFDLRVDLEVNMSFGSTWADAKG
ncbi:MAG: DNA polymerase I [Acidimicrobiales bacterium AG-410-I20]|nr:MAG: DNA polymerase I [Acidimicrobiales bacterium AG-410-I20]